MKKKYLISVTISVYNAENYLEETVESIVNQTIGFDNIELILVDDCSKDNSRDVMKKIKDKYPNNTVLIFNKQNEGVSVTRNKGIMAANGKYINIQDSDDLWAEDAFEKAIDVLEKHKDINFVSVRRKKFELENDYTQFDYQYDKGDRIVNIFDDYDCIQAVASSVIMRTESAKELPFHKQTISSEDAKFMLEHCLHDKKFYLLGSTLFHYRIRNNNTSVLQTIQYNKIWYSFTTKDAFEYMLNYSKKMYGRILPFAQFLVMYHLRWKYDIKPKANLTKKEEKDHIDHLVKVIKQIEDYIILEQRRMGVHNKIHVLNIKYNNKVEKHLSYKNGKAYYKDLVLNPYDEELIKILNIIENRNSFLIRGIAFNFVTKNNKITLNNKELKYKKHEFIESNYFKDYDPLYDEFCIEIPKNETKIVFKINNKTANIGYHYYLTKYSNKILPNYDIDAKNNSLNLVNHSKLTYKNKILLLLFNKFKFVYKNKLNKIDKLRMIYCSKLIVNKPNMQVLESIYKRQNNIIFRNKLKEFYDVKDQELLDYINKNINNFIIKK